MKNKQLLFLLASAFLLTSCNGNNSIKPGDGGDSGSSNISVEDPDSVSSSLTAGIGETELTNIITSAKTKLGDIKTSQTKKAYSETTYEGGISGTSTSIGAAISIKKTLYDNSVLLSANTASDTRDYIAFGLNDETLGNLLTSYSFINSDFTEIQTRGSYKKDNGVVSSVARINAIPYTLANYDTVFTFIKADDVYNVYDGPILLAGKLESGEVFVRFSLQDITVSEPSSGVDTITKEYIDFYYLSSTLVRTSQYLNKYYKSADDVVYPIRKESQITEYSINKNGNYNHSDIPEITVE